MTDGSYSVIVMSVVDVLVLVTAIAILAIGLFRGVMNYDSPLPVGANIVAAGLAIAIIGHVLYFLAGYFGLSPDNAAYLVDVGTAAWFSWFLSRVAFFMIALGFVMAIINRRNMEADLRSSRSALQDLEETQRSKDMRFQYLFNSTSNAMYSYRFDPPIPVDLPESEQVALSYDAKLSQCNQVFARELGGNKPRDVVGQAWSELESSKDRGAHEKMFRQFIANDYRVSNYPLIFKTRSGVERSVNVNMVGLVSEGGLKRLWGVESNVLEYQQAQEELRRQQNFQQLVARVSSRLVKANDEDADDAVATCLGEMCAYLQADRSLLFWLDDSGEMSLAYSFSRVAQGNDAAAVGELSPKFLALLGDHQTLHVDNVASLQDEYAVERKNLESLGVRAFLAVPMTMDAGAVGCLMVSRIHDSMGWLDSDVGDLRVVSELLANFILRLKSRRALSEALHGLQRATDRLEAENVYLREEVELEHGFDGIVGESQEMLRSLQLVEQVADTMTPVLILGETGTGKELVARAIHELSDRRERPLVKVNCAALPANLIESELFGHEKGAFTGADSRKRGRFDLAEGSTLFLDEIGEIPFELQAKLLRVLQEGEFERLGGTKTLKVDTRIVAATNRDLSQAVRDGEFRSDLYYRINTFPIEMPALRDRGDDIELLARHFIAVHGSRLGREVREISANMMHQLRNYSWPGNVRELDGIVQRALISSHGPVLELAEPLLTPSSDDGLPRIIGSTIPELKLVERDHILNVLESASWKISGPDGAATLLGMPPSTLRSKMKKLGIERPH